MISKQAKIGKNVSIGDYTKILPNVVIEDDVTIGDRCKIGFVDNIDEKKRISINAYYRKFLVKDKRCIIKKGTTVKDGANIATGVVIGNNCIIGNNAHIRTNCRIADNVIIGFNVSLEPFIQIGSGSQLSNFSAIGQTVKIGKNVFIAGLVVLAENKYMVKDYKYCRGPLIEDYVRIGCNSTIISCRIGKYSVIGANTAVAKDIPSKCLYTNHKERMLSKDEINRYVKYY